METSPTTSMEALLDYSENVNEFRSVIKRENGKISNQLLLLLATEKNDYLGTFVRIVYTTFYSSLEFMYQPVR